MTLTKEKFRTYELNKGKRQDVISLKLNKQERAALERIKGVLQQERDSSAIKQLVAIGTKVILDTPQGTYFQTVLENLRKNKRLGIVEVEPKTPQK